MLPNRQTYVYRAKLYDMARNPLLNTRVPPDYAEAVDEYCEEHGVSQSEAVRRAIRYYYIEETDDQPDHREPGPTFGELLSAGKVRMFGAGLTLLVFLSGWFVLLPAYGTAYSQLSLAPLLGRLHVIVVMAASLLATHWLIDSAHRAAEREYLTADTESETEGDIEPGDREVIA